MANISIAKLFIFSSIVLGSFYVLTALMPFQFFHADYPQFDIPAEWSAGEMWLANLTDFNNVSLAFPVDRYPLSIGSDIDLRISWIQPQDTMWVHHLYDWMIFMQKYDWLDNMPFNKDYVQENYNFDYNATRIVTQCTHHSFYIFIWYNQSAYVNISQAWDGGELNFGAGIGASDYPVASFAWAVVTKMMTFSMPDVHPMVNALIAIPLWSIISIVAYYIITRIIPFIG